jgi:hypothetical protein
MYSVYIFINLFYFPDLIKRPYVTSDSSKGAQIYQPGIMISPFVYTIFCIIFTFVVTAEQNEHALKAASTDASHIIFFGDSLMRYQYLAYVYKIHFHTLDVPLGIIDEKLYDGWVPFFKNTTEVFGGAMTCDCFREASILSALQTFRENRRYTHPSGLLVASYYPLMGYVPIQGMHANSVEKNFGKYVKATDWHYSGVHSFVTSHLSAVEPAPSVVFVNSGHWHNKVVAKNPHRLLALLEDVILSRAGGVSSGTGSSPRARKCVAWVSF